MTDTSAKRSFTARPGDPDRWVKVADVPKRSVLEYTARLTIDVTPAQRGRTKVAAFERGTTVADMLRDLLAREFPESNGRAT